jgi:hypothetical protein
MGERQAQQKTKQRNIRKWIIPRRHIMFSQLSKTQQTTGLWMWRMEYEHHEQRPLYFGEWF